MFITNSEFEAIKKAIEILPSGKQYSMLNEETQEIIIGAELVLMDLIKKKRRDNKRQAEYVAKKRKIDRCFGRGRAFREKYGKNDEEE